MKNQDWEDIRYKTNRYVEKLEQQIKEHKQKETKLKHKIQLLQMDGELETRDLLYLLAILDGSDE